MAHYGTKIIPLITLEKIKKVPIAFFVGKQDDLADPIDTLYVSKRISTLIEYKLIDQCDHYSFSLGKDMSFVKDAIDLVEKHKSEKTQEENLFLF